MNGSRITLDELIALSEEIRSLSRAGVPLESGLRQLGQDLPGRLGRISTQISQGLAKGEPLHEILERQAAIPDSYRAVVMAGVRGGRLAAALEGIVTTSRRMRDLHRSVAVALLYPLVVIFVGYLFLVFALAKLTPTTMSVYDDFVATPRPALQWLQAMSASIHQWWFVPPLMMLAAVVGWHFLCRRAWSLDSVWWRILPGIGRMVRAGRLAAFAEVLALLLRQQVPLPEAVKLAGEASGDASIRSFTSHVARRLADGVKTSSVAPHSSPRNFPHVLAWALQTETNQPELTETIQSIANTYRLRAVAWSRWFSSYAPAALGVIVGGGLVLLYALTVMGPPIDLIYQLSIP